MKERTSSGRPPQRLNAPSWVKVSPFFVSSVLFLSAAFAIFAPLPLLFLNLRRGRTWALGAAITNSVVVALAGGVPSLLMYLTLVVGLALVAPELLRARASLQKTGFVSLGVFAALVGLTLAGVYFVTGSNPVVTIRQELTVALDFVTQNLGASGTDLTSEEIDSWKKTVLEESPSALAIFGLLMVWLNLVVVFRANPGKLRESLGTDVGYLSQWKTPEWLVWPTLAAGATLVFDMGIATVVGTNVFKFLMALYGLQGLSILAYFFDLWGVVGLFRLAGYVAASFLMLPLLLSLGFFDLWFDFRSKFRQS